VEAWFENVGRPASMVPSLIVTLNRRLESDGDLVGVSSGFCKSVSSEVMEKAGETGR
jgi:hypothetical protein